MEKNKSDIGHNSNLLLEDALRETIKDAYKSSVEAGYLALKLWGKFSQVINQCTELTDKQRDWNYNVDKYNDFVMQNDPNPATNKKRLRKKYKTRKLTNAELIKLHADFEDDLQKLHELSEDPAAYLRGSENPFIEEIIEEANNEKKV
jgi:hypothetical protein